MQFLGASMTYILKNIFTNHLIYFILHLLLAAVKTPQKYACNVKEELG